VPFSPLQPAGSFRRRCSVVFPDLDDAVDAAQQAGLIAQHREACVGGKVTESPVDVGVYNADYLAWLRAENAR
jgi:hypothetical protein